MYARCEAEYGCGRVYGWDGSMAFIVATDVDVDGAVTIRAAGSANGSGLWVCDSCEGGYDDDGIGR